MSPVNLLIPILALFLLTACGSTSSVEMTRTINVLDAAGIPPGSVPVSGFRLGIELDSPVRTEATWTAETATLPAAGSESPPCNDGTAYRLTKLGTRAPDDLFIAALVIGDTGAEDISDDRDCGCDTHISRLSLNNLIIEPAGVYPGLANLQLGKEELCPNRLDDLVVGDREFGGAVTVELSGALRVIEGGLFLEVRYFVREVP